MVREGFERVASSVDQTGTVGKLNVFDLLRAACGCLRWRSARLILKPFKYSDTLF